MRLIFLVTMILFSSGLYAQDNDLGVVGDEIPLDDPTLVVGSVDDGDSVTDITVDDLSDNALYVIQQMESGATSITTEPEVWDSSETSESPETVFDAYNELKNNMWASDIHYEFDQTWGISPDEYGTDDNGENVSFALDLLNERMIDITDPDGVLIDDYWQGIVVIDSFERTANVATVYMAIPVAINVGDSITVADVSDSSFNGTHVVSTYDETSGKITFADTDPNVANTPGSGTVGYKGPPSTLYDALNYLAKAVSNNGANPIGHNVNESMEE